MTVTSTLFRLSTAALVAMSVSACQTQAPGSRREATRPAAAPPAAQADIDPSAPTLDEVRNASIKGIEEAGGPVTLVNGRWEGKPYVEGGTSAPSASLVRNIRLAGDLDGDGREEAVALVAGASGGTGETSYVAVLKRTGPRQIENTATAAIGDRVQVRDARLDGRRIVLDLVQAGEKDAACCPGDLATRTWELRADGLAEGAPVTTGRLDTEALGTGIWVLRSWAWNEAAPAAPEVTMKLEGARLAGSEGCSTYVAPVKAGPTPGDVAVGPVGKTRKMCPEADTSVEQRFTKQLGAVKRLGFVGGQLALSYAFEDGTLGVMLFDRRPTPLTVLRP
jgi:heat shock protein HslJ